MSEETAKIPPVAIATICKKHAIFLRNIFAATQKNSKSEGGGTLGWECCAKKFFKVLTYFELGKFFALEWGPRFQKIVTSLVVFERLPYLIRH